MKRINTSGTLRYKRSLILGQTTRPYYNQQKKENLLICGLCRPSEPLSKILKKSVKIRNSTWALLGNWKTMEDESDGDTNCNWYSWYSHQRIGTRTGGLGNKRKSGDHPNYSIIEIGQITEKSPEDLRKLEVTQISMISHRWRPVWKTRKGVKQ